LRFARDRAFRIRLDSVLQGEGLRIRHIDFQPQAARCRCLIHCVKIIVPTIRPPRFQMGKYYDCPSVPQLVRRTSAVGFTRLAFAELLGLARYSGKVVVIVNVASKCGYTSQYEQLQELHEKYSEQGLAILGFPCNQFLWQEPGSAEEIQQFCRLNYAVTFEMFAKIEVKGKKASELYRFLTSLDTKPRGAGKIGWNFEKFIIDRDGFVVARFGSSTKPDAPEVVSIIESELAKEPHIRADGAREKEQEPGQAAAS
jgi:glutathione peroxidase